MASLPTLLTKPLLFIIFFITIVILSMSTRASATSAVNGGIDECQEEAAPGGCVNKAKALPLKIIAIVAILVTSIIGVCAPLVTKSVPALHPDRSLFVVVKAFASGIILATGFMHVLPDSFDMLSSECLPEKPWHRFPFTGFVAMLSAVVTLMVDAMATSVYTRRGAKEANNKMSDVNKGISNQQVGVDLEKDFHDTVTDLKSLGSGGGGGGGHLHGCHVPMAVGASVGGSQLLRHRVVAMVLELGIVVHSVVIGLSLGASNNTCTIKSLVAALCFHQMFEGMGLGGCILQGEFSFVKKAVMAFFFSVTTPLGIAVGIGLSNIYKENSPNSLAIVGVLNASSAGLLIYMALVDLLSAEFMGPKLQNNMKLQLKCYVAVLVGAGGMSVMAIWA
ncbi:hypothetical protein Syun_017599 [Stephania yunnanensis]|uniref:Uncharacterized protein n=1 Tax=Stephania yunnanensis TaxID=152371 RepID=A0AAP0J6U8_9MAGN